MHFEEDVHTIVILFYQLDVSFSFSEDSYRANEAGVGGSPSFLPVVVFKNARIASRIELVIVPLTVDEARASSLPLPPNIPPDNSRSPPLASNKCANNY